MRQTFCNGFTPGGESGKNLEDAERHRDGRLSNLEFYEKTGSWDSHDDIKDWLENNLDEFSDLEELRDFCTKALDMSPFHEYGLSFDFVAARTFDDQEDGYYRYQFCYGGPSSELRIYCDGTVEFVYLDWFTGVGWDVSHHAGVKWLVNYFEGMGSIDWDSLNPEDIEPYDEEE
jgi:hypothetical protein